MPFPVFSARVNYHKNGIWWYTKMLNRVIGEERYDRMRLFRRTNIARFYWTRQEILYETFLHYPEIANTIGIYPKTDLSHGFPSYSPYEMFRDFQENSINSDVSLACAKKELQSLTWKGWFAMFVVFVCACTCIHEMYSYMLPHYWLRGQALNGEETRYRMRDTLGSAVYEEIFGNQWMEICYSPHSMHYKRNQGMEGYMHADDPRMMHISTFNRKHKMKEHYMKRVGDNHHMTRTI